ncbi:cysteine-rich DPF motif domain-containing protein 1 isoform X4 [Malaclemys terrapin pileata]|uniref:cysteine-rich DPF motif domain-containing protein 1 isoform X4 n=1 Tax=Malaclemys terrapin pileata TaxID=2991368 RepID=UPI0023A84133|nr:cysteine-rich DPF motif domain-containing protein 1 isoform X4 [Malaclemys terrapin pileata]
MDSRKEAQPKGDFECQLCGLTAPYSYYGQKPPNTHSVVLLEESYVMKDPFVPDKDKFLILGSQCSLCNRRVCVGTVLAVKGKSCITDCASAECPGSSSHDALRRDMAEARD